MDNPWATVWDHSGQPGDQDTSTPWSVPEWPAAQGTVWLQGDTSWDPSANATSEQGIITQDQRGISKFPTLVATEPRGASVSDHQHARSTSPPRDSSDPAPETTDGNVASVTSVPVQEDHPVILNPPVDDWGIAWGTTPPSDSKPPETQPPDQWEAARQEREKLMRTVPPESLGSLLRHCQQVSEEIWPASETNIEDNWRTGFDNHADIAALLAQLAPADPILPPTVQFSATATAKAMNEALTLTRHLPVSANSPLSRLLASKGSLEWEKSIKAKQHIVPDTAHVGWRVLEKEDRLSALEDSKSRKVTGGLLSFWNRRVSAIQAVPVERPRERSTSPARSSQESVKSVPHPPSSRAASPSKAPITSMPPPPPTDAYPTVGATTPPPPSAVSRFLNRFSRTRSTQHNALALSSDDLEFLSDIVPSASDAPNEDISDSPFDTVTNASHSSPLPPKLPPPIPPLPKSPILPSRPSSALGPGTLDGVSVFGSAPTACQTQTVSHTPNVPVLVPPLSLKPATSFSRPQSHPSSLEDIATSAVASGRLGTPSIQQTLQPSSRPTSRPQSSFTFPPLVSIPPLLPPPPVSPPQTPRLSTFPSTMQITNSPSFHDPDDEFSAFTSFQPSAPAPFLPSIPYRFQGPPSPPSPPPRRSYKRHYPSSSSTSSILSPASQSSLDQLYSTRPSVSASSDSFDDFISPPPVVRGENRSRTPSPPPLPAKPQLQHREPLRLDTFSSRAHHVHTPSQTFASPTVYTSLINGVSSVPSVSRADHQRTQTLVNHAAARGGMLWPNSPDIDEPRVRTIPPPSTSMSPKSLIGQEGFDLLGDGDTLGGLDTLPPLNVAGAGSRATTGSLHTSFGAVGEPGQGLRLRNQLQPSPPPLSSVSAPIFSFSLGTPVLVAATNPVSLQPAKPKQTGGLSAQDLSFFEGL